jgi:hypothetical protein
MQESAPGEWMKKLVKCDWCDETAKEVGHPHSFDMATGEKMCKPCWDKDRMHYRRTQGEDIGPFRPIKEDEA